MKWLFVSYCAIRSLITTCCDGQCGRFYMREFVGVFVELVLLSASRKTVDMLEKIRH